MVCEFIKFKERYAASCLIFNPVVVAPKGVHQNPKWIQNEREKTMLWTDNSSDGRLDRLFSTAFYRRFVRPNLQDTRAVLEFFSPATITTTRSLRTNMLALVGGSFTHAIQAGLVSFMVSVRKVEASDSESSIDKLLKLRNVPACGAQRANNLALTFLSLGLGHDLFKRNVGAAEFRVGSSYFGLRKGHDS